MARIPLFAALCAATLPAWLAGCAGNYAPSVRLALDGPPLAVAMRAEAGPENGEAAAWTGTMDRGCMAGVGAMTLRRADGVVCRGETDRPATDKGRLYMELACTNGDTLSVVYRNLGPDQGMGLGRVNARAEGSGRTTLFYHPSQDEAGRRLEEVRTEIADALESGRAPSGTPEDRAAGN